MRGHPASPWALGTGTEAVARQRGHGPRLAGPEQLPLPPHRTWPLRPLFRWHGARKPGRDPATEHLPRA